VAKTKQKNFTVNVQVDSFVTVEIKADNIKEALEKAHEMSTTDVWNLPGATEDESHKITGIFEG
jgi:hypothetical protein